MAANEDWYEWHRPYDEPGSPLATRLLVVQRHITGWLDSRPGELLTCVSVCAGQGRDLLGVLESRPDARRVRARLIELDDRNVAAAEAHTARAGLSGVEILRADAGDLANYAGAVPADLLLFAGVLGNVTDEDARRSVAAFPSLCAPGGTVIWTRTREEPDLTPAIRGWLSDEGFEELAFEAPPNATFSVGVHRLTVPPSPITKTRIFTFVR
ncbi:class I SAM-dependent methyltransferase family protein [Catenuloplanes japonicus]|uniref:class I SAM-dependent methyltransferase family protein n=1 Tax=Catenuloplanes japonicus TaxID=33876 RepID=UPI000527A821|nr:class I SAM-dependent methyltransferase family protein [Catenuloplanes japonicus]